MSGDGPHRLRGIHPGQGQVYGCDQGCVNVGIRAGLRLGAYKCVGG